MSPGTPGQLSDAPRLTSLQQRLFKTGGRLLRHARYFTLQLAESQLTRTVFRLPRLALAAGLTASGKGAWSRHH